MSLWSKRLSRYPLKVKIAGSSPVSDTHGMNYEHLSGES